MEIQIGLPQAVYLALTVVGLIYVGTNHGGTRKIDFGASMISTVIVFAVLIWGGFFS